MTIIAESDEALSVCHLRPEEFDLGRGHAMALIHVIKNGPVISAKHVGTDGVHRDETNVLYLDGIAERSRESYSQ